MRSIDVLLSFIMFPFVPVMFPLWCAKKAVSQADVPVVPVVPVIFWIDTYIRKKFHDTCVFFSRYVYLINFTGTTGTLYILYINNKYSILLFSCSRSSKNHGNITGTNGNNGQGIILSFTIAGFYASTPDR